VQYFSRVSAWRRELNSHEAASPQTTAPAAVAAIYQGLGVKAKELLVPPPAARAQRNRARNMNRVAVAARDAATLRQCPPENLSWVPYAPRPALRPQGENFRIRSLAYSCASRPTYRLAQVGSWVVSSPAPSRKPLPNPSLKPTRYGRVCKPGLSQLNYRLIPGLQPLPPRAA
jgi:hypothetical protein